MKTIDEILKRDDYKKLVPALRDRAKEVAKLVLDKMASLDMESFYETGFPLRIVRGRTKCGSYEYLAFDAGDDNYAHQFYCLDGRYGGYIHGDFYHPCFTASDDMLLKFLNNARAIIEKLDEIETEKVKSITEALKDVEEL